MIVRIIGFLAGLFAVFIITGMISTWISCDDEDVSENKFGPRPTGPEPGKGVLITTYRLPADEQYKSKDE